MYLVRKYFRQFFLDKQQELDTVQQVKEEIEELREYVNRLEEHSHRRKLRLLEQVTGVRQCCFFLFYLLSLCFKNLSCYIMDDCVCVRYDFFNVLWFWFFSDVWFSLTDAVNKSCGIALHVLVFLFYLAYDASHAFPFLSYYLSHM